MVERLLLVPLHTLLRIYPNQRLLRRALTPGRSTPVLLLVILRLLLHPSSISASKSLPAGISGSTSSVKTACKDDGTTGVRAKLIGTIAKIHSGRR